MAVSKTQFKVIKRAIKTRLTNGEDFDEIIVDYPNLSEEQIAEVKAEYGIVEEVAKNGIVEETVPESSETEENTETTESEE